MKRDGLWWRSLSADERKWLSAVDDARTAGRHRWFSLGFVCGVSFAFVVHIAVQLAKQ